MGWKKLIFGEKMPDKDDPKYKDRYEKEVETGKKFARITRIDKAAASLQRFANEHRNLFLAIVFGIVICCFTFNIYRIAMVCMLRACKNKPQPPKDRKKPWISCMVKTVR